VAEKKSKQTNKTEFSELLFLNKGFRYLLF